IGGAARNNLGAYDATLGQVTGWNPGTDQPVFVLASDGSTVYVGGTFHTIGGLSRNYVAGVSALTGVVSPWAPSLTGDPDGFNYPYALAVSSGVLYVGGRFTTVSGNARPYLAAFDVATGNLTTWNPAANGRVWSILPLGGTIYAGGEFTAIGGSPRNAIAALN